MEPGDSEGRYAVLFVDDEEKARKYFRLAFSDDFPVLTAADVSEALSILEQLGAKIGVLITDQRMPGQRGVDLLKRARENWPGIMRILTTAYSDLDDAIVAVNRGEILRYITKPWDIDSLRTELKHAMDFFLLRRERDMLLEEKISVRRGMAESDRLRGLLAIAAGLRRLRHAPHAVAAWSQDAVLAASRPPVPPAELELWGFEVKETLELMAVQRNLRALDLSIEPGYPDQVTPEELAASSGIHLEGQGTVIRGRREMLIDLVRALRQLVESPTTMHVSLASSADGSAGVSFTVDAVAPAARAFEGDVSVHVREAGMLTAYLTAWHHGGRLQVRGNDEHLRVRLLLPAEPEAITLPEPDANWVAQQFAMVEA